MADRRSFATVAGTGVLCGALAALGAGRPWVSVDDAARSVGSGAVSNTLEPYAQSASALALALVALAAWGVLLVVRGRARTVMAAVGLVFAAALLVVTLLGHGSVPDTVRQAMTDQFGARSAASVAVPHTGWYWLALVAAVGDVLALGAAVRRAHRWPAMGARYDAPSRAVAGEQDMWRSLDEGRDPTDPGSA